MEAILKQISNPEWWFTVVAIGLVIGVVAGYVKDWLSLRLSALSSRYKIAADQRRAKLEAYKTRLAKQPLLLIVEYLRAGFSFALAVLLLAGSFILPAWEILRQSFPKVDVAISVLGLPAAGETTSSIVALVSMLFGLFFWALFSHRIRICEQVRSSILRGDSEI